MVVGMVLCCNVMVLVELLESCAAVNEEAQNHDEVCPVVFS